MPKRPLGRYAFRIMCSYEGDETQTIKYHFCDFAPTEDRYIEVRDFYVAEDGFSISGIISAANQDIVNEMLGQLIEYFILQDTVYKARFVYLEDFGIKPQ